jgi:hypothetical protein
VKAGAGPELLAAAQALRDQIKARPAGEHHSQHVQGDFNAVADRGSSASINISGSVGINRLSPLRKDGHSSGCSIPISGPSNVAILAVTCCHRMLPRYN